MDDAVDPYRRGFAEFAARFESISFESVHRASLPYLPSRPVSVLDVGAGSGRDAAWFAARGCDVVAVEPASTLRELARRLHPDPRIRWEDDRLPSLARIRRSQLTFEVIWLSAVWMHLRPEERSPALRRLATLLRPGGRMFVTLRRGPPDPDRIMFDCSPDEIERIAAQLGLIVRAVLSADDALGRVGLIWNPLSWRCQTMRHRLCR